MFIRLFAAVTLFFGLVLAPVSMASAAELLPQCKDNPESVICKDAGSNKGKNPINETIGKIARIVSYITGIASVFMIIVGGIRYTLSDGDSTNTNNARKMILYAAAGLVITVFAGAIAAFLTKRLF